MDSKLASDSNFIPVGIVRLSPRSRATKDRDLDALQIPRLFGVWHGTMYDMHLCPSCMIVDNNVSTVCCIKPSRKPRFLVCLGSELPFCTCVCRDSDSVDKSCIRGTDVSVTTTCDEE